MIRHLHSTLSRYAARLAAGLARNSSVATADVMMGWPGIALMRDDQITVLLTSAEATGISPDMRSPG